LLVSWELFSPFLLDDFRWLDFSCVSAGLTLLEKDHKILEGGENEE